MQDYRVSRNENQELYSIRMDTNGLASGCHFLEAVASGVYELIERDAMSCHLALKERHHQPLKRVKLDTIRYQSVLEALEKIERAGVQTLLYDCTVDTEVPVFKASIYDKHLRHSMGICEGYGAHLDPEVAMIRAITEAVQGRTIAISGSRDDIFMSQFNAMKKNDVAEIIQIIEANPATIDAASYTSGAGATLEEDIHILMRKLKNAGLSQLLVFDLSQEKLGMSVVRVIIPGLEGYYSRNFDPGLRAKKFISERATTIKKTPCDQREGTHFPAGALL
jgi:ribosomal protein S12 methylthiotransferase accessory factor